MYHILAVDDDKIFLKSIRNMLEYHHYQVTTCSNPVLVDDLIRTNRFDCVLLDVKIPGIDGIKLLNMLAKNSPDLPVIMISGQSTIKIAVEALKKGAFDFIEKPVDADRLLITLKNALKTRTLEIEKEALMAELEQKYRIVAVDKAMLNILKEIETIAPTIAKVLITGETGVGKELVARALHFRSKRSSGPFVKINCAAIPTELIESELFGYKKGAFTGAIKETIGKFQMADGGTLFLDEIGDMNLMLQSKLLHVIQDNEFMMLGSANSIKVDVRIIAATNRDLNQMVHNGEFREDLYHRLNVINIHVPPLRERPDDILPIARHFLAMFTDSYNKRINDFTEDASQILRRHNWPGNVRELRNVTEKLVIFSEGPLIHAADVLNVLKSSNDKKDFLNHLWGLNDELLRYEREYIIRALNTTGWKMNECAKILGIDRSTLYKKMQKLNIKKDLT